MGGVSLHLRAYLLNGTGFPGFPGFPGFTGFYNCYGSLWIPACFGVRRQSGATASNLSAGGYQQCLPGAWVPGSTRAAATAPAPRHGAQSKAAASRCTIADPAVTAGTADAGRYRGRVAAARQKVRGRPAMIVSSPTSIKTAARKALRSDQRSRPAGWTGFALPILRVNCQHYLAVNHFSSRRGMS